jgi:hypothetical protein
MALKRPPTHRIDAPIVLVLLDDPAWDFERIKAEQTEMEKAGEDPKRHPYVVYQSGASRYDLEATSKVLGHPRCAQDYLDESKSPARIKLRRLSYKQYYEVETCLRRDALEEGYLLACRYGLDSIDASGWKVSRGPDGKVDDETMQAITDEDPNAPIRIGASAYLASKRLSDAEGKA